MARAIDQDEVLYQLERLRLDAQLKDECEEEAIKRCISAVKLVPTLTPPNEWVSVENAVPDPGERVLATDGTFVGEAYRTSANTWYRHTGFPWRDCLQSIVTLWMPLPTADKDNHVPAKAPNEPLTLEQLREMDEPTPVWWKRAGFWCLCERGFIIAPNGNIYEFEETDGIFYRHPPEGGDADHG